MHSTLRSPSSRVSPSAVALLGAAFAALGAAPLLALNVTRNDADSSLNDPAAWASGSLPDADDVAVWNSGSTRAAAETFSASTAWGGILVSGGTPTSVSIAGTSPVTLTLGAGGINLNQGVATNRGLAFNSNVSLLLSADQTWSLGLGQSAANLVVPGQISGPGRLTVSRDSTAANTLTLAGANTFTGGFTLEPGAVVNVTTTTATIAAGGFTTSSAFGAYDGSQPLVINGGRFNLPGLANAFSFHARNISINGDFTFQTAVRTEFGGAVNLGGGTRTMTLTRNVTPANALIAGGNVALRFSGIAAGPAAISNGTLRLTADAAVPAGNLVVVAAAANTSYPANTGLTIGEKVVYLATTGGQNQAANVPSVTLEAGSYWNLAEAATSTARNPQVNSLAGAGTVATLTTFGSPVLGTLTIRGTTDNGATDFSGRIVDNDPAVFPTSLNGSTAVVKTGPTTQIFSGLNTYSGGTTLQQGTLQLAGAGTLGSGAITVGTASAAPVLDLGGISLANTNLTLIDGAVTNGALALSGATTLSKGSVAAALSGPTAVTKTTGSTVTLSGAQTYTGATNVTAGRLDVSGSLTSAVTVASDATLGGEFTTTGSLTFAGGTSSLFFDPSTPTATTATSINATGATVRITPSVVTGGAGLVVLQSGAPIAGGLSAFQLTSRGTLALSGDNRQLLATIPTPGSITLRWVGGDGSNPTFWDANATSNFANGGTGSTFFAGDNALFNDTASTFDVAIQSPGVSATVTTFDTANTYTVSGSSLNGTGALVKTGTGTLILSNPNTFTGSTSIQSGVLQLGAGGTTGDLAGLGPIVNDGTLRFLRTNTVTQGVDFGIISGSGALVKDGANTVVLNQANTYSGVTTVNSGTLSLGHPSALGSTAGGTAVVGAGSLVLADGLTVTGEPLTIGGPGANSRGVIRTAAGSATWAGDIVVDSVHPGTGLAYETRLGGSVALGGSLTLSGVISGGNAAHPVGTSGHGASIALRSDHHSDVVVLSGANTFAGNIAIYNGILRLAGGDNRLPATARVLFQSFIAGSPNKLDLNGTNQTVAGIHDSDAVAGAALCSVTNESATPSTFTVDSSDVGAIFSGFLSGNLSFTKAGSGSLTLAGTNSYTGHTRLTGGALTLAGANLADAADVYVSTGTQLNLGFGGTDTVRALFIDGVQQPAGVYGAIGSGAANTSSLFAGSGTLTVTDSPVSDPFVGWTEGFSLAGPNAAADADPDRDGTANLLEWVLGGNPTVADASAVAPELVRDATHLNLVFDRADASEGIVTLEARWGTDLTNPAAWNSVPVGASSAAANVNGVSVTVVENGASPDTVTVSVPLANAVAGRLFLQLRATK